MRIRLGYVAICETLNISASHNITYSSYIDSEENSKLIDEKVEENIKCLSLILDYNIKNNIHFYRLTSKLIPLATHKEVNYDFSKYLSSFSLLGEKIKNSNMRVDCHPDQFCVLNSVKSEVVDSSIRILDYHCSVLEALKLKPQLVLHVGGVEFGKEKSISRFVNNFNKLPDRIKNSILVENDDKIYDVLDVLKLCEKIKRPLVLDYHHYLCNNSNNINLGDYMDRIFNTWNTIPKMHFSSPKGIKRSEFRSHSDYIDVFGFIEFIDFLKKYDRDVDIMLECKKKDDALFKLVRQLKLYTNYKFIDETTFEV